MMIVNYLVSIVVCGWCILEIEKDVFEYIMDKDCIGFFKFVIEGICYE